MNKNKTTKKMANVLRKRTVAVSFFAMGIFATLFIFSVRGKLNLALNRPIIHNASPDDVNIYSIKRLKGFKNIQPVVSVGPQEESNKLFPLKNQIEDLIDSLKNAGIASDVSVFVKNFKRGRWISINEKEQFHPASLMKVPLMLAVLKIAQASPGMLEQKIVYKKQPEKLIYQQHFQGPAISEGKTYTVHDLIYYCAANSDNNATHALESNIDLTNVVKLFHDIGLPDPDLQNRDFTIGAKEYSSFMETIFNSAFLSPEYSEYAAEMLANCSFKEGFSKGLPEGTKLWHKFGESTRPDSPVVELHESGVIFVNGKPFLLTVMTRGKDLEKLTTVLQKISRVTYRFLNTEPFGTAKLVENSRAVGC